MGATRILRHTTAHVMAHAVLRIFKDVEFAIGPTIEDGFYYDFALEEKFTPEHFEEIEKEMAKIVSEDIPIRRLDMSKEDAFKKLEGQKADFKIELLNEVADDTVSSLTLASTPNPAPGSIVTLVIAWLVP